MYCPRKARSQTQCLKEKTTLNCETPQTKKKARLLFPQEHWRKEQFFLKRTTLTQFDGFETQNKHFFVKQDGGTSSSHDLKCGFQGVEI